MGAVSGNLNAQNSIENNSLNLFTGEKQQSEIELHNACMSQGNFSWNGACQSVYQKWMKQSAISSDASLNPKDWQLYVNQVAAQFENAKNACKGNDKYLSIVSLKQLEAIVATYGKKPAIAEIIQNTFTGHFSVRELANSAESMALAYTKQWGNLAQHGYNTIKSELPSRSDFSSHRSSINRINYPTDDNDTEIVKKAKKAKLLEEGVKTT